MNPIGKVYRFYRDGLAEMKFGRTLWLIIIIKLLIMFLVLRLFFFRPALSEYKDDTQKARHVIENLTAPRD